MEKGISGRIIKNTIFLYIRSVFIILITLYTCRVVLSALGVVDYGIYNIVGGIVVMFSFLNMSMTNGVQRFFNYDIGRGAAHRLSTVFQTALTIQVAIAFITILLAETVGLWFVTTYLVLPPDRITAALWAYQLSIASFVIYILQVPYVAIIMAHEQMGIYAYLSIADAVLKLGAVFLLSIVPSDKLILYAVLMAATALTIFTFYVIVCRAKFSATKFRLQIDRELFTQMIHFSGWNIFGSMSGIMKDQGVNILLNVFFGPIVNTARGIAVQVYSAINSFINNFQLASRPQTIQAYSSGERAMFLDLIFKTTKFSFFLMILPTLPILFETKYIIDLWLSAKNVPAETMAFTRLIILIGLIDVFAAPISTGVYATGKMKKYQVMISTVLFSIIPLSYLSFEAGFGPESTFYIGLAVSLLAQALRLHLFGRMVGFHIYRYFKSVILPCAKVVIMAIPLPVVIHSVLNHPLARFACVSGACIIITLAAIYRVGLTVEERYLVITKLKQLIPCRNYR